MPQNKKTVRAIELNEGIVSCICGKTFVYESIKDLRLKVKLHNKFCYMDKSIVDEGPIRKGLSVRKTERKYYEDSAKSLKKHFDRFKDI